MENIKHLTALVSLLWLSFILSNISHAQVGVGTDNPSSKAVLHLESSDKGLIIPKMNNAAMDAMTVGGNPETGTLVYNTDVNEIFTFKNGKWYSMTPFHRERSSNITKDTIRPAVATAARPLEITSLNVQSGYGVTPLGGIIMWSGKNPPDGWVLCDGSTSNGYTTPNLSGRFIVGYDASNTDNLSYNFPGNYSEKGTSWGHSGGDNFVTLTSAQSGVPGHTHGVSGTINGGNHRHGLNDFRSDGLDHDASGSPGQEYWRRWVGGGVTNYTEYDGGHTHSHSLSAVTNATANASQSHENRPRFYVLAFIMRVK
ncbi:MAG: tail fiber protein [Flavobacteriales bacterium]|nr:tail fiber protein [Flavobacteriales bacterium]